MKNKLIKFPTKSNLRSRASTISNAFAISITPCKYPTENEIKEFYKRLEIREGQCAYCLGEANAMDHIKPLVNNGLPTGYITEIKNLVPCCAICNSSKGKKEFAKWYKSESNLNRLRQKGLSDSDIQKRYEIISNYISNIDLPIDYRKIVGDDLWNEYIKRLKNMIELLRKNQEFCDDLNKIIEMYINSNI